MRDRERHRVLTAARGIDERHVADRLLRSQLAAPLHHDGLHRVWVDEGLDVPPELDPSVPAVLGRGGDGVVLKGLPNDVLRDPGFIDRVSAFQTSTRGSSRPKLRSTARCSSPFAA